MNREKQLAKNTIIVAVGKICTQFVSFFLLPLYTALLSTEEYGIVDLLNTYISLLIPLLFFQIDQAIFRFLIDVRENDKEKIKIISSSLITVLIQIIIYCCIYFCFNSFIDNKYKLFLLGNIIASMISGLLLQISRGLGDNFSYSIGSLISGAGTVILNVIFIVCFKWGAIGMLTATMIANILCSIFVFIKKQLYRYIKIKSFDKNTIKSLWKYSIPLVPNQLSWWIINASNRTIISYFLSVSANGIFSAANKFSSICVTIFGIFNITWAESASIYINDKDNSKFFSNIVNSTLKIFIALCFGIIAFMPFVFSFLITGDSYADAYYQIPILMLSTIFSIAVSLFGSIYVALKKSKEIAKTSIYAAVINIIINILLIKFIGLYAASIGTLLSYMAMAIYRFFDVQKYVKIKIEKKLILVSIITALVIISIYYIRETWICLIGAVISIVFALYFNMQFVKYIFSFMKGKLKIG